MRVSALKRFINHNYRFLVVIFFLVYFLVSFNIFDDYGISWDEHGSRHTGKTILRYVTQGDEELFGYFRRYYGPVFETCLAAVEQTFLHSADPRDIFLMRHFLTFLLFFVSTIFFYYLCRDFFGDWKYGLLGSACLILTPRIFAHSFYNPKDIPLLALFVIAMYTLVRFRDTWSMRWAVIHALVCALVIDVRMVGLFVVMYTLFFFIYDSIVLKQTQYLRKRMIVILAYVVGVIGLVILFWPLLWRDPIGQFVSAWQRLGSFGNKNVFYFGEYMKASQLPWHYVPVWIAISTPLMYVFFFLVGCVGCVHRILTAWDCKFVYIRDIAFMVLWFFVPIATVMVTHAGVYDGWRHMFFVYPGLILISLYGLLFIQRLSREKKKRKKIQWLRQAAFILFLIGLAHAAISMIRIHPYENVYFNVFAGKGLKNKFALDYWGLSYKQGLEYILKHDAREVIPIAVENWPGMANLEILKPDQRERIHYSLSNPQRSSYFLTNFRGRKHAYAMPEYHSIMVNGEKILTIYDLKQH